MRRSIRRIRLPFSSVLFFNCLFLSLCFSSPFCFQIVSLLRIRTTAREKVLLSALDSRSTSKATDLWRRVHSKGYFSQKCKKQARHFNKSLKYNAGLILACPLISQYFERRTNTLRDGTNNRSIIVYHVRINFL